MKNIVVFCFLFAATPVFSQAFNVNSPKRIHKMILKTRADVLFQKNGRYYRGGRWTTHARRRKVNFS